MFYEDLLQELNTHERNAVIDFVNEKGYYFEDIHGIIHYLHNCGHDDLTVPLFNALFNANITRLKIEDYE